MHAPPLLPDEEHRLQVLFDLNILDTPSEERFDRITRLVSRLFDVPMALVSLIDANRQWFKSRIGVEAEQTECSVSFCAHAILQDTIMIVEDARNDERFANHPLVTGDEHIRFYAGYPLAAPDGSKLGTLCLVDRVPREFNEEQRALLKDLANMVANEMAATELNRALQQQRDSEVGMRALLEHIPEGVVQLNGTGIVLSCNPAAERIFGGTAAWMIGRPARDLLAEDEDLERLRAHLGGGSLATQEGTGRRADGTLFPMEFSVNHVSGWPAASRSNRQGYLSAQRGRQPDTRNRRTTAQIFHNRDPRITYANGECAGFRRTAPQARV